MQIKSNDILGYYDKSISETTTVKQLKIGRIDKYNKVNDTFKFIDIRTCFTNVEIVKGDWIGQDNSLFYVFESLEVANVPSNKKVNINEVYHRIDEYEMDSESTYEISFSCVGESFAAGDRDFRTCLIASGYLDCLQKSKDHNDEQVFSRYLIMYSIANEINDNGELIDFDFFSNSRVLCEIDYDVFSYGVYETSGDADTFNGKNVSYELQDDSDNEVILNKVYQPMQFIYVEEELFSYDYIVKGIDKAAFDVYKHKDYPCYVFIPEGVESIEPSTFDGIKNISIITNYLEIPSTWHISKELKTKITTGIDLSIHSFGEYVKRIRSDKFFAILGDFSESKIQICSKKIESRNNHLVEINGEIDYLIVENEFVCKYQQESFVEENRITVLGIDEFLSEK